MNDSIEIKLWIENKMRPTIFSKKIRTEWVLWNLCIFLLIMLYTWFLFYQHQHNVECHAWFCQLFVIEKKVYFEGENIFMIVTRYIIMIFYMTHFLLMRYSFVRFKKPFFNALSLIRMQIKYKTCQIISAEQNLRV